MSNNFWLMTGVGRPAKCQVWRKNPPDKRSVRPIAVRPGPRATGLRCRHWQLSAVITTTVANLPATFPVAVAWVVVVVGFSTCQPVPGNVLTDCLNHHRSFVFHTYRIPKIYYRFRTGHSSHTSTSTNNSNNNNNSYNIRQWSVVSSFLSRRRQFIPRTNLI